MDKNNNPSNANDNDQVKKKDDDPKIDLLDTVQCQGNEYLNASPRHNTHNKFESMEQRREAKKGEAGEISQGEIGEGGPETQ